MLNYRIKISGLFKVSINLALFAIFFLGMAELGFGQEKRRYATRQIDFSKSTLLGLGGSVINPNNSVNGDPKTAAKLNYLLGAGDLLYAEQAVDFNPNPSATNNSDSPTFPAGTPITIKLALPQQLLGVLTGVIIQPITNLRDAGWLTGWTYDDVGTTYTVATLLGLLSGAGESEITIAPNVSYQGIRIRLTSALGLSGSMDFFHAYVMESGPELDCTEKNTPIDVLSGARSADLDLLSSFGDVTDPYNAINGNLNDHATMTVGVGALNTIYLNTIFPTPSEAGQRVRILLEDPGGLLNLGLLSSFKIQPMLGSVAAGPQLEANSSLLSLRLLPGTTKYELAYTVNEVFDRIEIRLDNTVTALTSLKVYDVSRAPGIILIDNPSEALNGCGQVDLNNAIANYQPDHYTYNYYTTASGGTPLASSLITTSGNYYIEAVDPVTGCASPRVMVTVAINPIPTLTLSPETSICIEDNSAMLNYSNVTNGGNQYKITWNEEISGLNNVEYTAFPSSGPIIISGLNSITDGNYNGTLTIRNTSTGCESEPYNFKLKVLPTPGRAQMTIQSTSN